MKPETNARRNAWFTMLIAVITFGFVLVGSQAMAAGGAGAPDAGGQGQYEQPAGDDQYGGQDQQDPYGQQEQQQDPYGQDQQDPYEEDAGQQDWDDEWDEDDDDDEEDDDEFEW